MLSIVICVYNTDRGYLVDCLESVASSTLVDYEICILDDGSTVDYSDIAQRFGARYKKTENQGIFRARLAGIAMARGEYIAFMDSDDTVSFNYHRPMVELCEREGADVVMNDWAFHTDTTRYFCGADQTVTGDVSADGDLVLDRFLEHSGRVHAWFVLWNKVFRRELLVKVAVELLLIANEKPFFNYSEDALMNFFAFSYAKKVRNLHTGYYFYRVHSSQSVNVTGRDRLESHIRCMSFTLSLMAGRCAGGVRAAERAARISEWASMMSRTHYSYAKAGGHTELYGLIRDSYGVDELRVSTMADGSAYSRNVPLPENFSAIDDALRRVYLAKAPTRVAISGKHPYIERTLCYLESIGHTVYRVKPSRPDFDDGDTVVLPKPRISLKKRLIFNPLVYKTGMLLFKKGSKLRALLKRKM